jgi:hypothetical protein
MGGKRESVLGKHSWLWEDEELADVLVVLETGSSEKQGVRICVANIVWLHGVGKNLIVFHLQELHLQQVSLRIAEHNPTIASCPTGM